MIQSIVADINTQTGESECRYYKERLLYPENGQKDLLIDSSRILSCHGELKNNRGAVKKIFGFWSFVIQLLVGKIHISPKIFVFTFPKNWLPDSSGRVASNLRSIGLICSEAVN